MVPELGNYHSEGTIPSELPLRMLLKTCEYQVIKAISVTNVVY